MRQPRNISITAQGGTIVFVGSIVCACQEMCERVPMFKKLGCLGINARFSADKVRKHKQAECDI
ncbi:MAG: hypothetical protein IKA28_05270 [Tidjanibacter sp.]|nr:hypothetical protein [Tidjanibacter sp.]